MHHRYLSTDDGDVLKEKLNAIFISLNKNIHTSKRKWKIQFLISSYLCKAQKNAFVIILDRGHGTSLH